MIRITYEQEKALKAEIEKKKERLELYYKREEVMLKDGVQSYGVGTRNIARYNTALKDIQTMINQLKKEIAELESLLAGGGRRKAVGVIPRDW